MKNRLGFFFRVSINRFKITITIFILLFDLNSRQFLSQVHFGIPFIEYEASQSVLVSPCRIFTVENKTNIFRLPDDI